jgi:uncharacterized protein YdaU (DUF1376 family)
VASKKTDTWMPFYVTDYLGDTMHLTTVQHGAYLLLLLACWKAGGVLEDDDTQLSTITRLSPPEWKKNAPVLRRFFSEANGHLEHGRVLAELNKAKELSDKRTAIGKKGGRPPKAKQLGDELGGSYQPTDNQTKTNRFPEGKANPNQNETPSPSPSTNVDTGSLRSPRACEESEALTAGEVCKAMKLAGVADVNPGNQTLRTLIDAGATLEEFTGAAAKAVAEGKGFAYAIGIVRRDREQAAQIATGLLRGPLPSKSRAPVAENFQTKTYAGGLL